MQVEQNRTPRAAGQLIEKFRLAEVLIGKGEIGNVIFKEKGTTEDCLGSLDPGVKQVQYVVVVGYRERDSGIDLVSGANPAK